MQTFLFKITHKATGNVVEPLELEAETAELALAAAWAEIVEGSEFERLSDAQDTYMVEQVVKHWHGEVPDLCELCKKKWTNNVFFDAAVRVGGRSVWGLVCETCHRAYGNGLGTGKGQKYNLTTKEKLA